MAGTLQKWINLSPKTFQNLFTTVRYGHHLRGKPPGVARTLEQRLQEINYKDPSVHFKVDIGLPAMQHSTVDIKTRTEALKSIRNDKSKEKESRNKQLLIDLTKCKKEWEKSNGAKHLKILADHYGIFEHLFGDAFFHPRVPLQIEYDDVPVYCGNIVKPAEATKSPSVQFESEEDSLWTLILTNPDGNFTEDNKEYLHWFIGNIPGNKLDKGEQIIEYLQPFPPKGTGYHRHIFILYKQEKKLDFSNLKKSGKCLNLNERIFSTLDFYRERQDDLTPAGLAFFQADWDTSLKDFFHNSLNMKEPIFEYDFPKPEYKEQTWFPLRQAFNLYMDRYRDPKQINKEFLLRKLKNVHPFKPPKEPLPYPNAAYHDGYIPSWLKSEKVKSRLGRGRINDV